MKFNSLQVRGEKRFTNGLIFQGNFTWASAFDYANDYFFWNPKIDYGREGGVRRFVFNFNQVYELPFGKNKKFLSNASRPVDASGSAGGNSLAIWLWESGYPFTPGYLDCGKDEDTGPCRAEPGGQRQRAQSQRAGLVCHRDTGNQRNRLHGHRHGHGGVECQRLYARSLEPPAARHIRKRGARLVLWAASLQCRYVSDPRPSVSRRG